MENNSQKIDSRKLHFEHIELKVYGRFLLENSISKNNSNLHTKVLCNTHLCLYKSQVLHVSLGRSPNIDL